jgi:DNA-binding Lrp family transcriptional regulator
MVTAIVLIKMDKGKIHEAAEFLAEVPGVSEVYSVAGPFDLVAVLRVEKNEAIQEIVTEKILSLDTIADTETLIAFRAYSRHDLEEMFSIGFEEGRG